MKVRTIKDANLRMIISLMFFAFCAGGFAFNTERFTDIIGKITLMSASSVLPTGVDFGRDEVSEAVPDITEGAQTSIPDDTSEAPEAESSQNDADSAFSATPDDVKQLMQKYSETADKDKKGGKISSQTYKSSGVTDSYGRVRVKNVNDTGINIKKLLSERADLDIRDKSKPSVLIFHTHTTETYQQVERNFYSKDFRPRSDDPSQNMVRVGVAVKEELEKAGYNVIHDTTIYDSKYNGAYSRSREAVAEYLREYPDIQIVLDIHRDAIQLSDGTKIKPVCEIDGKKCAQIMIISGCQESGNGITGFEDWRQNLTFAVQLQDKLEKNFEGITRPLYFSPRKYNMDMSHCSVLLEMGSDANTLEEAVYAGKCLGFALADLMGEYTEDT